MTVPRDTTETSASLGERARRRLDDAGVFWLSVAIALASLGFLGVRPDPAPVELAVFAGTTGLAVLAVEFHQERHTHRGLVGHLAVTAALFVAVVGGTWLLAWQFPLWQAALASLGVASLLGYGLYRYQLVTLGLAEASNDS